MRRSATQAIRAQLIAAMETRAASLDGEARRVLDARLAALHAQSTAAAAGDETTDDDTPNHPRPSRGPLGELVDSLTSETSPGRAAYPELPTLESFRNLWSGIRSDSQLQQAVTPTPTNAGPLNSAALASRSIALMRELSPEYLRQFLAYVDDLAWLEQMGSAGAVTASGAAATRKRARRKPGV